MPRPQTATIPALCPFLFPPVQRGGNAAEFTRGMVTICSKEKGPYPRREAREAVGMAMPSLDDRDGMRWNAEM